MIEKLAKKTGLSAEYVTRVLAEDVLLRKHVKKKAALNFKMTNNSYRLIKKISKILKVSMSALISIAVQDYIQREGRKSDKSRVQS